MPLVTADVNCLVYQVEANVGNTPMRRDGVMVGREEEISCLESLTK